LLKGLFGGEFGFAVELDGGGRVAVFVDGVAEVGGPEAVGGDEDESPVHEGLRLLLDVGLVTCLPATAVDTPSCSSPSSRTLPDLSSAVRCRTMF